MDIRSLIWRGLRCVGVVVLTLCATEALCTDHRVTDMGSIVQVNRALPRGRRVTAPTLLQLNQVLRSERKVTDSTLIQLNRALERIR